MSFQPHGHVPLANVAEASGRLHLAPPSDLQSALTAPRRECSQHFDPCVSLDQRAKDAIQRLCNTPHSQAEMRLILEILEPLRLLHLPSYEHSLRVGLLASAIARNELADERTLFFAGLLHDCGKANLPEALLSKCGAWTAQDNEAMKPHVLLGYERLSDPKLSGQFDFVADIIVWHHRFGRDPYPATVPSRFKQYSEIEQAKIQELGLLLAMADCYDACHRINCRHGRPVALSGEQIKEKLLLEFPKHHEVLERLYKAEILTTAIFE